MLTVLTWLALFSAAASCVAIGLACARFLPHSMAGRSSDALWLGLLALALTPWAWLLGLGALVARARLEIGAWPHGPRMSSGWRFQPGNVDPAHFTVHHHVLVVGMLLLPLSLVVLCAALPVLWRSLQRGQREALIAVGALGWLALAALVAFDPGGLLDWLAD